MINIQNHLQKEALPPQLTKGLEKNLELNLKKSEFAEEMKATLSSKVQEEINELIKNIDQQGKLFTDHPSGENLRAYKQYIQSFLSFVSKNSTHVKEFYGRRKDYKIVQTINSKLEDLSKDVIHREIPRLELLSRVEEIRGLVVDLVM